MTFGVEVTIPDSNPTALMGFADEAEANRWIARNKDGVAKSESLRRAFFKSAKRRYDSENLGKSMSDAFFA